nr:phosphoglycerate mutase family protein [Pedobacter sp. ASV2]
MKKILLLLSLTFIFSQFAFAQTTEIWIVRHAEKDKTNPADKNPNLSDEGKIRAGDLSRFLKKEKFKAAFSTPYNRTHQTLDSLIAKNKITITDYNVTETKELVENVKKNFEGKTVIIAGHSNTVLELIEAFGGKRPKEELTDDDYDYIFHLTLKGDKARVKMDQYGRPHHL